MKPSSLLVGALFLFAGVYQVMHPRLPGLRRLGFFSRGIDEPPGFLERALAYTVGFFLVFTGLFFVWKGF